MVVPDPAGLSGIYLPPFQQLNQSAESVSVSAGKSHRDARTVVFTCPAAAPEDFQNDPGIFF